VGLATRTDRPIGSPTSRFARRDRERTRPSPEPIPPGADGRTSRTRSLSQPRIVGAGVRAVAGGELDIALRDVAGVRLLVSDVRVALLLVDEARHRAVERVFGVSREQSWQVTLIALALLAGAAHDKSDQLLKGPGGPTRSDVMLGAAGLRELLTWIPGPIVARHTVGRHFGDGRTSRSPGPSGGEPGGPRHQDLLAPSSALVQPSVRPSSARQGDQRRDEKA
jgi:hypothetical protein